MAARRRSSRSRARGRRRPVGPSVLSRTARRFAFACLAAAFAVGVWAVYLFAHTPREDRNPREIFDTAVDRAEDLYARVPTSAEPLKTLPDLLPGGNNAPLDPNAEVGKLDEPILIARVVRVVDGDTLVVETGGKEERVRLLRVNTPESVHPDSKRNIPMGERASIYTKRRLEGRQVRLQFEAGTDRRDRYDRLLCYVFVEDRNFNLELVEEGWSPYYTEYGKSKEFDRDFREAERSARDHRRGIWGDPELAREYEQLKKKWSAMVVPVKVLSRAA